MANIIEVGGSYMTKSQFDSHMAKTKQHNIEIEYRQMLWKERTKYWPKFKVPSTSKLVLWAGFIIFVEIIFFCQYLAVKTMDTSPLVAMIGAIGGLISMFHTYSKKSTVENSRGGIVFETALLSHAPQKPQDDNVIGVVG